MALSKLRFVERVARASSREAEQARLRCIGQPDHTLCDLPSKATPFKLLIEAEKNSATVPCLTFAPSDNSALTLLSGSKTYSSAEHRYVDGELRR
jgi:hypothetical protein